MTDDLEKDHAMRADLTGQEGCDGAVKEAVFPLVFSQRRPMREKRLSFRTACSIRTLPL